MLVLNSVKLSILSFLLRILSLVIESINFFFKVE